MLRRTLHKCAVADQDVSLACREVSHFPMPPPPQARTSARYETFRLGDRQSILQQPAQLSAIRTQCAEENSLHKWAETEKARVQPLEVLGRE